MYTDPRYGFSTIFLDRDLATPRSQPPRPVPAIPGFLRDPVESFFEDRRELFHYTGERPQMDEDDYLRPDDSPTHKNIFENGLYRADKETSFCDVNSLPTP